jgi:uncharacterized protein (TIGR03790 family)
MRRTESRFLRGLFFSTALFELLLGQSARALEPRELLLIANRRSADGLALARFYQEKRHVPPENLVLVTLPEAEDLGRDDYQERLVEPLREFLRRQGSMPSTIRCLVLFYGIPLRVAPPELSHEEWRRLEELKFKKKGIDWQIANAQPSKSEESSLQKESGRLAKEIAALKKDDQGAAVDSELTLALNDDYPLAGWLPNPYFVRAPKARVDGPNPTIVHRMIEDSLTAERNGLRGRAYFDARWPLPKGDHLTGYALYDASLHQAARVTKDLSHLPVTLDQQEKVLQPGSAPDAALYCGWYSLGHYVDAFDWKPGAVAWHIASSECVTLKKAGGQGWCKRLLEDGVAATLGPVAEPYVQGFPLPDLFFTFLLGGDYTLVESYFLSLPWISWQMILIGDPLYRPFAERSR